MTKDAFILNIFKIYNILWKIALPFLKKNRRLARGMNKRILAGHHEKAHVWIQAASAGEAYIAVKLLRRLKPENKIKVLVTSTTSQGMDILESKLEKTGIDSNIEYKIEWFPFDIPENVKEAVARIDPLVMIPVETEIWPCLLYYLKQNRTKVLIINARLSRRSFRNYLKTRFLWEKVQPDTVLAVSYRDAERYARIFEKTRVETMKNIKFESIESESATPDGTGSENHEKIFPCPVSLSILASIRKQEEADALKITKYILDRFPDQIVAVFPRHMHRIARWKKLLSSSGLKFYQKSRITEPVKSPGIILWDSFGELKTVYGLASTVFVGGSLKPLGGQNFIEPAIQGAFTVTGPFYDNFAWAEEDIFKKNIVKKAENWKEAARAMVKNLERPRPRQELKNMAREYIETNMGGTKQACDEILRNLDVKPPRQTHVSKTCS